MTFFKVHHDFLKAITTKTKLASLNSFQVGKCNAQNSTAGESPPYSLKSNIKIDVYCINLHVTDLLKITKANCQSLAVQPLTISTNYLL